MADGEQSGDDRTEAATARHLAEAREQGQVAVSHEVTVFASLTAVGLVLLYRMPAVLQQMIPTWAAFLARSGEHDSGQLRLMMLDTFNGILPVLGVGAAAGSAVVLIQTQFLLSPNNLKPKISRANPVAGIKRLFGLSGLVEVIKSLVKLLLLVVAFWIAARRDWARLVGWASVDPRRLPAILTRSAYHLLMSGLLVQGIVACGDLFWVRFRHARDLRMSKQDVRDELKETEGNPHVKAKIRRIQVVRARQRMMAKVPTATAVVTNPTHYAVALVYDRAANPAPRIVAKGADSVAAKIREIAQANGVPIVSNPPLARALYRLDLDTEIPAEHYKAVAEIIAYVWRLRRSDDAVT